MTRDEVIDQYNRQDESDDIKLITSIFDDFESRICENCRSWGQCTIRLEDGSLAYFSKTYGCNKFQRKE